MRESWGRHSRARGCREKGEEWEEEAWGRNKMVRYLDRYEEKWDIGESVGSVGSVECRVESIGILRHDNIWRLGQFC